MQSWKVLEEDRDKTLQFTGTGQEIIPRTIRMAYIKLSFYTAKNSINSVKTKPRNESLSNYIPGRGLISRIYRKLQN